MTTVSVIIPIYNMENYLKQCLDSVLEQSLQDIEIICINDGSSDNSLSILEEYQKEHKILKVINQKNQGVSVSRNNGIKEAKGEFIAFMDPDDYYLDEKVLEDLYRSAKQEGVKICGGSFSEDHGNWIRKEFQGIYEKYTFNKDEMIEYKNYQFDYGYHRFIYNREMLINENIMFPEYIRFQDPPFFVKAMIHAKRFYALKRVSYCYRWGHQKINWNEKRAKHVLLGLIDNLELAKGYQLKELYKLTVKRILEEYKEVFINNLNSENKELLGLLLKVNTLIDRNWIEENEIGYDGILPIIQSRFNKYEVNIQEIYNSTTYKTGDLILYFPKKIKIKLKK